MRLSRFPLMTMKETPADAEIVSHQLMLRAGLIRRVSAGLYTWLPLGLKVLRKVEQIVREEMDRAGALEVLMPGVQPAELWQESGRWEQFGPELLRLKDRHERDFCLGPTHEEVITDIVRRDIRSYKQLPLNMYQLQWKFRDEIRPRFGVMRAREFLMKDAYSFHTDEASLATEYLNMHAAYCRIFDRLGLKYRAVLADSGAIGGNRSQEFHVLAGSGEDAIAFATGSDYAANIEMAEAVAPPKTRPQPAAALATVDTPDVHTMDQLAAFLDVPLERTLKTLLVRGSDGGVVALCLRGDHQLNDIKAEKLPEVATPLEFASPEAIKAAAGCEAGSVGPVGLRIPVVADRAAAVMADFVCGANDDGRHLTGVNWARDLPEPQIADIRNVVAGDPSPDGNGEIAIARGIEVGHIFQLGTKYSDAMNAVVLDEAGRNQVLYMGCYGIGVSRVVAAAIEQNHDERGIIWPAAMAPFQVAVLPMNAHKSQRLREAAQALYDRLTDAGFDVLLDDRDARPGVMFADMELIGIPVRVVLSEKHLDAGQVELKGRRDSDSSHVADGELIEAIQAKLG